MGFIFGIVAGVFLFILWKNIFGKYLPNEDATLLKILCCIGYIIVSGIAGFVISLSAMITTVIGAILIVVLLIITYSMGLYYKVVASKKFKI